ncbi:MAG: histidinol dehydrogenase, partial [Treponema sp.]|nr:histidinol dehydrogenase [Treponema sp.]
PTEVFIIADSKANEKLIAADMLAQAEHDVLAQSVLATPSLELAKKVLKEIEEQLKSLPTSNIAKESIENCGKIIITESLEDAAILANKKAPEHLELAIKDENTLNKIASLVHNYGSLFMGHMAAEVFGDYASGLNHTLPTSGSARFTGGLSVRSFLKTVTTLRVEKESEGFRKSGEASMLLAEAEGLIAHKRSVLSRME